MSIVIGLIILFIGVLAVIDGIWRLLNRQQSHVINWWSLGRRKEKKKNSFQGLVNPWAIPLKHRVGSGGGDILKAYVPWSDIDPSFQPNAFHCGVAFEFFKTRSAEKNHFRWKMKNPMGSGLHAQGVFVLDESLALFKAFDGVDVKILGPLSDTLVIHRPLGPKSMMRWSIRIPAFVSKEAANHYLVQNIHEIDRKLVQFIGDWH